MIQCHAFNSFARPESRSAGPYVLSQFVGGMAAVLFLFLAGVTFAFQMDRLDRKGLPPMARLRSMLRRAGYILGIAFLFRISNSLCTFPLPPLKVLFKVDILNCMGLAMAVLAFAALCPAPHRTMLAALAGLSVAAAAPLASAADGSALPWLVRDYFVPDFKRFAFFPWASYLAFGVAGGAALRGIPPPRLDGAMQWCLITGCGLVLGGRYAADLPYSLYSTSNFWLNSPLLILIRLGIILLILAAAYLWTCYGSGTGWSWVRSLGQTSLLVYWVHVLLVYGWLLARWKKALTLPQTALLTAGIVALMVALSAARLRWKTRRAKPAPLPAPVELLVRSA